MKNRKEVLEREIAYYAKIYPNHPKLIEYQKELDELLSEGEKKDNSEEQSS